MTLFDTVTYCIWISAIIGLIVFKKISDQSLRVFIIFQVISCISDILLIYVLPMGDGKFVRIFYSVLRPFEYWVYWLVFHQNGDRKGKRYLYFLASLIFIFSFSIYSLIFRLKSRSLTDDLMLIEGILTIVAVLLYFRDTLLLNQHEEKEIINLWDQHQFWIATGLLFFFTGNIIASGFYHKMLVYSPDFTKILYDYMNLVLGIIQSIIFGLSYIIASRRKSYISL